MIRVNCEQGSEEWFAARTGVASASNFDRILTASCKPSSQMDDYLFELTAEWVTGEKKFIRPSYWMERGIEMEPEARQAYQLITGIDVEQVGFLYRDKSKVIGCSPDGLATDRGLEIKCPAPINHVSYLLQGVCPKQYVSQVQGSMWVTGYKQWDFVSYHPDYEPLIVTVDQDPKWQEAFNKYMPDFLNRIKQARKEKRVIAMRKDRINKGN